MPESHCPICGSVEFYVKDPKDDYETYELKLCNGEVTFSNECDDSELPVVCDETTIHCNLCTWHGELKRLKLQ